MTIKQHIILIITALAIAGCSEDIFSGATSDDAVELTGIKASVEAGNTSRAVVVYLQDRISRYQFVSSDEMTFTKIQRRENPIARFQYRDVVFECNTSGAWERDKNTGSTADKPEVHPERVYWSDASSAHTFVGYSLPKDNQSFDWKKSTYYYDKDGTQQTHETYYGAIGDPTNASEKIDYNPETPANETITTMVNGEEKSLTFGYSQKLRDEDLLLTYDENLMADNSVANIKYYHALSSVRVIVNISGFYGTATDAYSIVSNMILHNQPTLYRWKQQNAAVEALVNSSENTTLNALWTDATNKPAYNQRKNMILWNTNPSGDGQGASKVFTFYGITVPQDAEYFTAFTGDDYANLKMSFEVTYPDPLKNDPENKTITKNYTASLANPVMFYPGKCTTINITLNHRDESMTVGASYQDWEYVETPDEGELKKKSTFLSQAPSLENRSQAGVTIVGDDKATADDATWLYNAARQGETEQIVDIYGNDGSQTRPYTISTANQLLSFAYEVKNDRKFEHKFVKLDADITLQPKSSLPTKDENGKTVTDYSQLVRWIGIGDATHPFNGFFLGNGRHINNLYGEHFFYTVGDNAVIDKLNFDRVVEVLGCGVVAHENNGLICSCFIEGDVKETAAACTQYTGSIVGTNNSFIIACSHIGKVTGYGKVGGLVGFNNGTVMASYHSGVVEALGAGGEAHPTVGAYGIGSPTDSYNRSIMFSCYYDSNVFKDNRALVPGKLGYPLPTSMMQSNNFVREDLASPSFNFTDGKYSGEGPILRTIAEDIVRQKGGFTEEEIRQKTDQELIAIILPANAMSEEVYKVFEHHFSLNTALRVFRYWLGRIHTEMENKPADTSIETNCHTFTKEQIEFLYQHYTDEHIFKYVPATYPKAQ